MRFFELLVEDDILAGELECCWEEVILIGLLFVVLFVETTLVFFKVFVKHIFAAELVPASKMVYFHVRQDSVFLEYPIDLFFLAPDHVPVIIPRLPPLSIGERIVDAVFESGFKLDVAAT